MKRHKAREVVFTMLFEAGFNRELAAEEIYKSAIENYEFGDIEAEPYIKDTFFKAMENIDEIDNVIDTASQKWSSDRISRVTRAVLRLAVCEIKYGEGLPVEIVANEAVEIAKKFDDEKAFSFVNGIIRNVSNSLTK